MHFRVESRRTWFETVNATQAGLDDYLVEYNTMRSHQGRGMKGRAPLKSFTDGVGKEDNPQPKPTKKAA